MNIDFIYHMFFLSHAHVAYGAVEITMHSTCKAFDLRVFLTTESHLDDSGMRLGAGGIQTLAVGVGLAVQIRPSSQFL
jgi:hypothetical protein